MLCCRYHWQIKFGFIKISYVKIGCITVGCTFDCITFQSGCMTIDYINIENITIDCMASLLQHGKDILLVYHSPRLMKQSRPDEACVHMLSWSIS